jgi:hypothetical protein
MLSLLCHYFILHITVPGYSIFNFLSLAGLSPSRIGSDLRCLYSVGALDDYELLKKQVAESQSVLAAAEAIIKERLGSFRMASPSQVKLEQ